MRYRAALPLVILTLPATALCAPLLEDEGRLAIESLGKQLQMRMDDALGRDGLEGAISVCNLELPQLARQVGGTYGFDIRRTSERYRNPDNAPDRWEQGVIEQFKTRQQFGQPLKGMVASAVIQEKVARVFRMAMAIPVQKPCLVCHGETLHPQVEARIDALYPGDRARGYASGELRGIFSLKRTL